MAGICDLALVAVDNNAKYCDGKGNPIPALGTPLPQILYQDLDGDGVAADAALRGLLSAGQATMTALGVEPNAGIQPWAI
jgi:hypothetical protein